MSIPDWTKDEQSIDEAKSYLREGNAVDFFEMISSCILREHPVDVAAFSLEIVQSILDGKETPTNGEFHPKKIEDNRYMREKNICDFLNEWVLALLKERPASDADRLEFHKHYLESVIAARNDPENAIGEENSEANAPEEEKPQE